MAKVNPKLLDTLWVHMQVDLAIAENGAQQVKCAILPESHRHRPCNEIGFTALRYGQSVAGFTPVAEQAHLLVVRLYWTPEVFRHKEMVDRATRRLYKHIRSLINHDPHWKAMLTAAFQGKDWQSSDYYSCD